jgi:hypothetical protein
MLPPGVRAGLVVSELLSEDSGYKLLSEDDALGVANSSAPAPWDGVLSREDMVTIVLEVVAC